MTSSSEGDREVNARVSDALRAMTEAAAPYFIGLTVSQAESLATHLGRVARMIDGPITFEFNYHRVNVRMRDGAVVEATPG